MAGTVPVSARITAAKQKTNSGAMTFPNDLMTHGMLFMFSEYRFSATRPASSPSIQRATTDSIILPLPQNLDETLSIQLNKTDLGNLGEAVATGSEIFGDAAGARNIKGVWDSVTAGPIAAIKKMIPDAKMAADVANSIFTGGDIPQGTADAVTYLAKIGIDKIAPSNISRGYEAGVGTTFNPKQALLFDAVTLKRHQWTWTLAPRSSSESDMINNIVRTFKKNALPSTMDMQELRKYMLKYPSICNIVLLGVDPKHFIIYKPIMIETISVNYTPNNGPSIIAGGRPSAISLSISGMETDMWTREDIDNFNGGYSV